MKLKVISLALTVTAILMGALTVGYSQDNMSTAEYSKTTVYSFTGSTNITLNATSARLPRLASIILTYPTARSNTFTFAYVRSTYTNELIKTTYSNQTLTSSFEADIYYTTSDQLQFNSTASGTGQLTLNWR